jgi:hypothetical protein
MTEHPAEGEQKEQGKKQEVAATDEEHQRGEEQSVESETHNNVSLFSSAGCRQPDPHDAEAERAAGACG